MNELYHFGVKGMKWGKRKDSVPKRTTKRGSKSGDDKKLVGNLTKKDAKKIGGRFLGSVAIRTIAELTATKTGKDWINYAGDKGASVLDLYNGYVISSKAIIPAINNKLKNTQKKSRTYSSNGDITNTASSEMSQQQLRIFMDRGREFTQMQLQQNSNVATNQIMGFY